MPAAAIVSPSRLRTIMVGSPAGHDPDGLLGEGVLALARPDPALGLADHLAGDDDDVAVGQHRRGGDQGGEVGPGADLRQPVGGADLAGRITVGRTSSIAAAAIAAVASWSVIMSGTAAQAIPAASTAATWWASESSTSQPSSTPPPARDP